MTAPEDNGGWTLVGTVQPEEDKRELRVWVRGTELSLEFTNHDTNRSTEMRFDRGEFVDVQKVGLEALLATAS